MSADQFDPAQEQGFPSNEYPSNVDTSSPYAGNRPASGARRATPGEVLSQGFQGADNAGDFLGLDVEFTGSQGQGLDGLDLVPPPGTYAPGEGEMGAPVPAPLPEGDAAQEFAQAPSAFEFGEDLGSEESFEEPSYSGAEFEGPSSKKVPLLVGGFLVAGLAGAGFFFGPGLYAKYFAKSTTTVAAQPEAKTEKPVRPPPRGEIAALSGTEAPASGASTPSVESTSPTSSVTEMPVASAPVGRESVPSVTSPEPSEAARPEPTGQDEAVVVASTTPPRTASGFPNLGGAEFQWATSDQTEMIWRGSEIPLDAVRAPVRTMTPKIGSVRVFTTAGENFDGRLYAVGQNRVWIDSGAGRIGLDGTQIERIEVLPPEPAGQNRTGESAPIAGGRQVRARVPGGMLYGRILRSNGEDVTIVLEDGGKVQVKAEDLEDLGSGRAVVVSR